MYVLFTVDFENNPLRMNVFNNMLADLPSVGRFMPMIGKYNGKAEHSFICRTEDFDEFIRDTGWIAGQESILHVAQGNKMECWLEYFDDREDVSLGCMHQVCAEEAAQAEAYTYSPSLNCYWIAKEGNPDGSYSRSVNQYRPAPVAALQIAAE